VLRSGEWIRVKGKIVFQGKVTGNSRLRGEFWLRTNTLTRDAGGDFTNIVNVYPNATPTPEISVYFRTESSQEKP
jgi:hypothetical protein